MSINCVIADRDQIPSLLLRLNMNVAHSALIDKPRRIPRSHVITVRAGSCCRESERSALYVHFVWRRAPEEERRTSTVTLMSKHLLSLRTSLTSRLTEKRNFSVRLERHILHETVCTSLRGNT